ncbi:MAG: tetratricopeptide repeat protein [Gemmataceae bacterium]|nr:tetratricopeptide repeat protein [Gemmata sp.]MDW8196352.1 tetratricopeptide repeat protein [Gemmataceae bacterium]
MATAEELFQQGFAAHQAGDWATAEQCYRQLLTAFPDHSASLMNLAALVSNRGDWTEAEQLYHTALAAAPDLLEAHFKLGNIYRRQGRWPEAAAAYEEVLRRAPQTPAALVNLGLVAGDMGNWPRAVDCLAQAATMAPDWPDVLELLGDALARCGRMAEACAAFDEATRRFPDSPRAHYNRGLYQAANGQLDEALASFDQALTLKPDYPEAHNARGIVLDTTGQADAAEQAYRAAIRARPDFADAHSNLGVHLSEQGCIPAAIDSLRTAFNLAPHPRTASALLTTRLAATDLSAEELRDHHIHWGQQYADPLRPREPVHANRPIGAAGRIRIGYVVGEFRSQVAAAFLQQLLLHHDRNQFHVTVYANVLRTAATIDTLRHHADTWRTVTHLSDEQLAQRIWSDGIDLLIDLNGHTPGHRLLVFARQPAPRQLTLFGYPATTGLGAMDYRITDGYTDPPGSEGLYVEKLIRLPEVSWVYQPPADEPQPPLAGNRRTFTWGCLNHPAKFSEPCLDVWAEILQAVPKSRLVLLVGQSVQAAQALAAQFTRRGIAADRVELIYRLPWADYLAVYPSIDLALDPFPYSGGATTCDALWMGVPVLTLAGRDARGRRGVSILHAVGLPEFIADSPEQYVQLATTWAQQREALAELRCTLRELLRQSPMTDARRFVRHLEAAYRHAAGFDVAR